VSPLKRGDHVAVIGAGPAGLTAAYLLSKEGYRVTVFEGDDIVGGISRTAQYKGYRFDIGGHRFFTKIEPVQALWEELLADEFISVPRMSRIHYRGRYFDYPLRAMNALQGLGLVNAVRIVMSYIHTQLNPSPVEDNFEQWVTNRFGKRLYEIFFKTYTEKVWGIPCTEIRAEWAAQRIQGLSLAKAIASAAALNKRSTKIKSLISEFRYPRLGPGQMWEAAAERVRSLGNRVLMNHRVTAIECETEGALPRRPRDFHDAGPEPGSCSGAGGGGAGPPGRGGAPLPGLPGSGPDSRRRKPLPRQLDLHPYPRGQGRPDSELQQLEQGHGAGSGPYLPRPGVFLFSGGRTLEQQRRGADRAGLSGAGRAGPRRRRAGGGWHRYPDAQGLPDL
jgi:hypothetical protein